MRLKAEASAAKSAQVLGRSLAGKAAVFGTEERRFESCRPSQLISLNLCFQNTMRIFCRIRIDFGVQIGVHFPDVWTSKIH